MASDRLILYANPVSGHSHRAELMLALLDLPYEIRTVDLRSREQKSAVFKDLSRFGVVPVLEHGDRIVSDSVAILVYLALTFDQRRTWLPTAPHAAALVQEWLSVAQGPLFRGPHLARLSNLFGFGIDGDAARSAAGELLTVMDYHLASRPWLVGDQPTIADVANYSYVALAPEGGVGLDTFPSVGRWLKRVEGLTGFMPLPVRAGVGS